jgi:hypothetical protein
MRDLSDPRWMKLKAALFGGIGLLSALLLWLESPRLITVVLLLLCVWAFCRLYYFAFYVIEHYIDPTFKFSGVFAACRYLMKRRRD